MKRKGFTLVELLAVIAILAILVIMALPAVLRMFNNARRDSFTNEVNTVIRTARQQYLLSGGTETTWTNAEGSTKSLELTGNSNLKYYIKMNNEGKITKLQVTNGDFQYNVTNNAGIDVASSFDVEEVTSENELVINSDIFKNYIYSISSNTYDGFYYIPDSEIVYHDYNTAINETGYNIFIRREIEEGNYERWCFISETMNSCNKAMSYATESECNTSAVSWLGTNKTYTCSTETFHMHIIESDVGFKLNNHIYYLKHGTEFYDDNKSIVLNAFGSENCTGDIAMSKTRTNLMNILGIQNVNAAVAVPRLTCSIGNITIVLYDRGPTEFDGGFHCQWNICD